MAGDQQYANLGPELNAALAQRALQYATPQTIPYIQHSAALADALRNIQQNGGQNLRTGGALASNLLAEALLQFSKSRADKQLLTRESTDRQALIDSLMQGVPTGGSQTPPADPSMPGSGLPPPNAAAQPAPASDPALLASALKGEGGPAPDWNGVGLAHDRMVRTVMGEDRNPAGQQAAASVILNRAQDTHLSPDQVIAAPHQFEPFDNKATWNRLSAIPTDNPAYTRAAGNVDHVLNGGPTTNADHFYGPQAQAQLAQVDGRPAVPSWDNGTGQMIGGNRYFHQGYAAPAAVPPMLGAPGPGQAPTAMAQGGGSSAPPGLQNTSGANPALATSQNSASPFQVASNGPLPMPSPGGPPPVQPPQQPQGGPQAWRPPPNGLPMTPQEQQTIQAMMSSGIPALQDQAMQQLMAIRQRALRPEGAPQGYRWDGQQGRYVSQTPTQTVPSEAPNYIQQVDGQGNVHVIAKPNYGAVPPGTVLGGNGGITPMQGSQPRPLTDPKERAAVGIMPSDHNAYAVGVDGKVTKVADNPYGPREIQSVHDNFWGSDETKKAQEAYSAFTGLTTALGNVTRNNGPLDQAAMDSFLRGINPGMGARNSTVQMVMTHFGLPQELQGYISSVVGNGFITPQGLQQMLQITHDYALAHQQAAVARAQADAKMVQPYGYGAPDLAEDLPQIGAVPSINFGAAPPAAAPQPNRAAAAAAELQRRGYHQTPGGWVDRNGRPLQ